MNAGTSCIVASLFTLLACAPQVAHVPPSAPPNPAAASVRAAPIEAQVVERLVGLKPEASPDGVVKVSLPRGDVPVSVGGVAPLPPFLGLTSWAAFGPGQKPGVEAMVMGDLVLFEDEVNPVLSAALEHGLAVTALHNHFFYDQPRVYFMHVGGEGSLSTLGAGVRAAFDARAAVRAAAPQPATGYRTPPVKSPSHVDGAALDALFGQKGQSKDGMYKATFGRKATAACGCAVGKTMGVTTWAAFAGEPEDAMVDGDVAVGESELQPVLKALRAGGIDVVAIHHHMVGETPRVLFVHYWGRGPALGLARTVKAALELTAWERPEPHV